MLELYSTVHRYITNKFSSQNSTFETTLLKQLPLNTFVIHTNSKRVILSQKLKPFRLGPCKTIQNLSDVTYELMSQDGFTFHTYRNHILSFFPKEPAIFPILRQYHPTSSLLTNPDTDSHHNNLSHSPSIDLKHCLNLLNQTLLLKVLHVT